MNKLYLFPVAVLLLTAVGCSRMSSLVPYYTPDNVTDVPAEVRGLWEYVPAEDDKTAQDEPAKEFLRLRILPDGEITVNGKGLNEKQPDEVFTTILYCRFFRVGENLYADTMLKKLSEEPNILEETMLIPGHMLWKIEIEKEQIRFVYPEELEESFDKKKLPAELTYVSLKQNREQNSTKTAPPSTPFDALVEKHFAQKHNIVFTAPGSVWEKILKETPELVFSATTPENSFSFKRILVQ